MVKMTVAGVTYEGSPQELKEFFEQLGAKFPVEEEYRKVVGRDPRVGDYVKFSETDDTGITLGKYYEILAIDEDGDPKIIDDYDETSYAISSEEFEIYEKVGEDKPAEEPLKVGDYAKIVDKKHGHHFNIGDIIKLVASGYNPNFKAERVPDGEIWYVDESELVKATDEEVAQAKAELERKKADEAERAKWAKIGRKPNEFKKGDIVRLLEGTGANEEGEIVEIAEDGGRSYIDECGDTYGSMTGWFELIAPVESRVDRD